MSTLVHEGIGGELRLADFDALDLSNLNRVSGGLADVGISKVVLAAREVAELDPYIRVAAFADGVTDATIGAFADGADVLVDECDGLEMKVRLRERARANGVPVVMATSHRGMLDVERFDLEPGRPPFHGLLGDVTVGRADRADDQAEGAVRGPHPGPGQPHRPRRRLAGRGQGVGLDVAAAGLRRRARRRDGGQRGAPDRARDVDRVRALLRRPRRAHGRRAPGPSAARRPPSPPRRHGRRCRRGPPPPARPRSASSSPARRRRRRAATSSRGGSRRRSTRSARSRTRRARRCWTSAGAPRCWRSARRSRPPRSARGPWASSPRSLDGGDGAAWELRLDADVVRPRRSRRPPVVGALLQPAHGPVAPDRDAGARPAGGLRGAAADRGAARSRAGRRARRARPRALPLGATARRHARRAALRGRAPRATASTSRRWSSTAPTARRSTCCAAGRAWRSWPSTTAGGAC